MCSRPPDHCRRSPVRIALLVALVAATLVAAGGAAGGRSPADGFYERKRLAATEPAYRRFEERVKTVEPGMSETKFLEVLEMEVLARHGEPYDARLDGYLVEASRVANERAKKGERWLVFGWNESGREVPRVEVGLRERRVATIRPVDPAIEPEPDEAAVVARAEP